MFDIFTLSISLYINGELFLAVNCGESEETYFNYI